MPVINKKDGTFSIDELKRKVRPLDDPHQPLTRVIALENTHNACGGRVLPISFIEEVNILANILIRCSIKRLLYYIKLSLVFSASEYVGCC